MDIFDERRLLKKLGELELTDEMHEVEDPGEPGSCRAGEKRAALDQGAPMLLRWSLALLSCQRPA